MKAYYIQKQIESMCSWTTISSYTISGLSDVRELYMRLTRNDNWRSEQQKEEDVTRMYNNNESFVVNIDGENRYRFDLN